MLGFYGSASYALQNASLSKTAEHCAGAKAAQASGKKQYRFVDVDKQVAKFCEQKVDNVSERCAGALEAQEMGKSTYRMVNTETQIAKWCSEEAALEAARAGQYTPSSPQEVAEELYWDESEMMTSASGAGYGTEEDKGSLLLPLAMGGVAILLLGGVILASR